MKKIYYENQYIKEFITNIIKVKNCDEKHHVVLEETAFFPGGGGQFCDLGFIGDEKVIDVYEDNGLVYHVLENEPIKKEGITCSLDWERRKDGMDQHLGQHVLSGCFFKLFNANTVSFHLGKEVSTVDIVGNLEEEQIRKAEIFANEVIGKGLNVEGIVPPREELGTLGLRRALPNTEEEIRVLKVGDLDINACCGVHPKSTMELRLIKIKKWEKNKGATRIEFLAGKRAIDDSLKRDKYLNELCRYLNTNDVEALNRVKNLENEVREILDENKKINDEMSIFESINLLKQGEKIEGYTLIKNVYKNKDLKYIRKVIERLIENESTVVLIGNENKDKANLIFAASKNFELVGMNTLLKELISLIHGKGGGNSFLAQGTGKNEKVEEVLEYGINKVKNYIMSNINS